MASSEELRTRAVEAADLALIEHCASYVQPLSLGRTAVAAAEPFIRELVIGEVVAGLRASAAQRPAYQAIALEHEAKRIGGSR